MALCSEEIDENSRGVKRRCPDVAAGEKILVLRSSGLLRNNILKKESEEEEEEDEE